MSTAKLKIADCAIAENIAWQYRNKCRNQIREFYSLYMLETGEFFNRDEAAPDERLKFDELLAVNRVAQSKLASARAATRRAIAARAEAQL
jgi:hypothetical protein